MLIENPAAVFPPAPLQQQQVCVVFLCVLGNVNLCDRSTFVKVLPANKFFFKVLRTLPLHGIDLAVSLIMETPPSLKQIFLLTL